MADSFGKKQKEKKKAQKRKEKLARKEARKSEEKSGKLDDMIAYVDEFGNIVDTPPDETKKKEEIKAEDIEVAIPKSENVPVEDLVLEGKVTFFNDDKGYGFIKDRDSQESYFVHMNNCLQPIVENDRVEFGIEPGQKGMQAVNVKKV
ncbi:cold shock domain-containing protein [Crocinitomicaceae bacterium]|jgi:cold shock CspA family protein|nr:cold shock domain-containing protein [Crocinitomicaceae bacterium]